MSKRPVMKHSKQMNNLDNLQMKIQFFKNLVSCEYSASG